jgi:hypothetical protein
MKTEVVRKIVAICTRDFKQLPEYIMFNSPTTDKYDYGTIQIFGLCFTFKYSKSGTLVKQSGEVFVIKDSVPVKEEILVEEEEEIVVEENK